MALRNHAAARTRAPLALAAALLATACVIPVELAPEPGSCSPACTSGTVCVDSVCIADTGECRADTCSGCCYGNVCIGFGDQTDNQCGSGAEACRSCTFGACTNGQCPSPSGCGTCAGCCAGSICLEGTASGACGSDGATCQGCTGSTTCVARTCQ